MPIPIPNIRVVRSGTALGLSIRHASAAASVSKIGELATQAPQNSPFRQSVRLSRSDGSILHFPTLAAAIPALDLDLRLI
jgi:hypothetical protein